MKYRIILTIVLLSFLNAETLARSVGPIANPETRLAEAATALDKNANQLAVYVEGLVCSSCGIGLRVHLSKIEGVDRKQFKRGVGIDPANQLAVVAFKEGSEPDMAAVKEAIHKAGYEPVHYYYWEDGSVQQATFQQD